MEVFVQAFSAFNAFAGLAGLIRALRMWSPTQREAWKSTTLYYFAIAIAASLPLVALCFTMLAWQALGAGDTGAAGPLILAPLLWLIAMGVIFATIDFAEDGRIDFGKGSNGGD
jgi:dipeptide/tripeptide permease